MPSQPAPEPDPTHEPAHESAHEPAPGAEAPAASSLPPSVLERVRRNKVGPLASGLAVAVVVALLLAILVPGKPNLYATALLGLLLTAAVGFTVRHLSRERGWADQGAAAVATLLGIHVMAITGTVHSLSGAGGGLLAQLGAEAPGFDDALLVSLATPAVSTGGVLCALVSVVIVGWGPRAER